MNIILCLLGIHVTRFKLLTIFRLWGVRCQSKAKGIHFWLDFPHIKLLVSSMWKTAKTLLWRPRHRASEKWLFPKLLYDERHKSCCRSRTKNSFCYQKQSVSVFISDFSKHFFWRYVIGSLRRGTPHLTGNYKFLSILCWYFNYSHWSN